MTMDDIDSEIKNQGGILPMFEAFYLESIVYAAERALSAFERFDEAYARGDQDNLAVANVQEALTHIGELSRIFWPSRDNGISSDRGEKLRLAFSLGDDSPLKNRSLRDTLEHFDERLDIYLKQFPVGQIIPSSIVEMISAVPKPVRAFRLLDPHSSTFVVLDEVYEFGSLCESTKAILQKAREKLENGARL
jgi:hypothetical protein